MNTTQDQELEDLRIQAMRKKVVSVDPHASKAKQVTIHMTDGVLIPKKDSHLFNSWRITFFSAIALLLGLVLFKPKPYRDIFLVTIKGAPVTFQVTILAIIGA